MVFPAGINVGGFGEERGSDDRGVDGSVEIIEGKRGNGSGGNIHTTTDQHDILHEREQFLLHFVDELANVAGEEHVTAHQTVVGTIATPPPDGVEMVQERLLGLGLQSAGEWGRERITRSR